MKGKSLCSRRRRWWDPRLSDHLGVLCACTSESHLLWACYVLVTFEDNIYIARDVDNPLPKPQVLHCKPIEEILLTGIKTRMQIWQWFLSCPYMGQVFFIRPGPIPTSTNILLDVSLYSDNGTQPNGSINRSTSHERECPYIHKHMFDFCWISQLPIYIWQAYIIKIYNKICV